MNQKIKDQKLSLQMALSCLTTIEKCDAQTTHLNYFKALREQAVVQYADSIAEIIENSIDIAIEFENQAKDFTQMFLKQVDIITDDYRRKNNITY